MAKFIVTYENGVIRKELIFRKKSFSYNMLPVAGGKSGDAQSIDVQLEVKYGTEDPEMLDAASMLSFGSDEEIEEALAILGEAEQ